MVYIITLFLQSDIVTYRSSSVNANHVRLDNKF